MALKSLMDGIKNIGNKTQTPIKNETPAQIHTQTNIHTATIDNNSKGKDSQQLDWKKFWKMNNKLFKLLIWVLLVSAVLGMLLNSWLVQQVLTTETGGKIYLIGTTIAFTAMTLYIINFTLTVSVKQDFNTGKSGRFKNEKLKGINWSKAESSYTKKKK